MANYLELGSDHLEAEEGVQGWTSQNQTSVQVCSLKSLLCEIKFSILKDDLFYGCQSVSSPATPEYAKWDHEQNFHGSRDGDHQSSSG